MKILPPEVASRRRLEEKARVVGSLNHPNIVAIYNVGEGFTFSELVDVESLRNAKWLRKRIDIAVQIAGGRQGLILVPLGTSTVYWPPGLLDPSTGQLTRIPVDLKADYHALN